MRKYVKYNTEDIRELGEKWYATPQWRHLRLEILKRDHYECQRCKTVHHRFSKATTVHHIQHLDEFPELATSPDNLVSLCESCHNEVHPEKFLKSTKKTRFDDEKW